MTNLIKYNITNQENYNIEDFILDVNNIIKDLSIRASNLEYDKSILFYGSFGDLELFNIKILFDNPAAVNYIDNIINYIESFENIDIHNIIFIYDIED